MASPPKVSVFVLCDAAIKDFATGKTTLVGTFDRVVAARYPATHGAFAVYFRMTGLNGQYRLAIEIVAPDLATVVASLVIKDAIVVNDPLRPVDAAINLPGLGLPSPGRYSVRLIYNGQTLEEITFLADQQS